MKAETLAIGDELLTGKISDTNTTFVANRLFAHGIRLERTTVIPDETPVIQAAIEDASRRADVVVCFGGLGPTSDDRTAEAVAQLSGGSLVTHEPSKERILSLYAARQRPITPQALKQALYPSTAEPIANPRGSAAGFVLRRGNCRLFFLPGVPLEMKAMFDASVLPAIAGDGPDAILWRVWRCIGIPESELQIAMDPVEADLPKTAWLGYRTTFPENHLTLYWRREGGEAGFSDASARIRRLLAPWTYTEKNLDLEEVVLAGLAERKLTVALAESCTGGLVAQRLTRVPGASDWLWGGYTAYTVGAKRAMLGVALDRPADAVSADCARRLAAAARRASGAAVGAAVTGYLGPTGGTPEDPIGTFYVAVDSDAKCLEKRFVQPHRERATAQWGAAAQVLNAIRLVLE